MLSPHQIEELRTVIEKKMKRVKSDVAEYTELTKPISPENAIGRISRMDAINNKSVNEAALRNAKEKLGRLERSLKTLDSESYGLCRQCGGQIEFEKLKVMPDGVRCVTCIKSARS